MLAPQLSPSVLAAALTSRFVATKPAGAYRPPGARGLTTPAIFKCKDEDEAPRAPIGSDIWVSKCTFKVHAFERTACTFERMVRTFGTWRDSAHI